MFVTCRECGRRFDDADKFTFCPHEAIDGRCVEHDLFLCNAQEHFSEVGSAYQRRRDRTLEHST